MPKATVTLQPVVYVAIRGEGKSGPHVLDDEGLVGRLLAFKEEHIHEAIRAGYCGAGRYGGFFSAEDAAKIEAWLLEQGYRPAPISSF